MSELLDQGSLPHTRFPGKTVYILGAGFSVAAGIPLMSNFVPRAFELLKMYSNNTKLVDELARLINENRAIASTHNIALENVEYLFCLVDDKAVNSDESLHNRKILFNVIWNTLSLGYWERNGPRNTVEDQNLIKFWEQMRCFNLSPKRAALRRSDSNVPRRHLFVCPGITYVDNGFLDEQFNCCVYEAFLSYVLHNQITRFEQCMDLNKQEYFSDAIICTNYYLVLEKKLTAFKEARLFYGRDIASPSTIKNHNNILSEYPTNPNTAKHVIPIIKIHGSINWHWN